MNVVEGVLEGHAVGKEPYVLLELLEGRLGVRAERAVCAPAREAQGVERVLELHNIGSMEVGQAQVEGAVAERVRGVDEGAPARGVHGISHIELHVRAELLNRFCGGGAELLSLKLCGIDGVAQAGEARLHVFDGRSLHTRGDCFHAASFYMLALRRRCGVVSLVHLLCIVYQVARIAARERASA